ncbi:MULTISPECIES: twin-arginine translocase subunit TatC [unclassified Bacillus (in: firmicutes)]|uniref:twin-arginine translocase subunit TatC n=1 Tax=Bacillaceae TaxID=186817 RepID=UPI000BF0F72F|nr:MULTISPECIES: twin-arginine translocase subunit TatC [unclassified Bacillus (in: firmicutes)]PEJ53646.1 twin-arginine translocase subunit TatC [Bacillus sp. AFS002410]PEL11140.1 twin-arginine translocase subunit TatC [Bacillus sp. AFS017336]QKE71696.1 twin-arginine translocase subunit TatC [Arthrobacter citreus]
MQEKEMSVIDHLDELRNRIIKVIVAFVIFLGIGLYYTKTIFNFLVKDLNGKLLALGPSDVLWIYLMIGGVFAIACSIPFIAYQIWAFVKPALHVKERKTTMLYIPALFILFICGLAFGYYFIFPNVLKFLQNIGADLVTVTFTAERYFSFLFNLVIPFAFFFDLPVIIMFLTSIGIVSPAFLKKSRRFAYFILIIIGTAISPPDFVSDMMTSLPLLVIYELSILVSSVAFRRRIKRLQQEPE